MNKLEKHEIYLRRKDNMDAVIHIEPKLLSIEADLAELKHPDYAFLSPAEATRQFRRDYTSTYQRYHKMYKNELDAHMKLGVNRAELFENDPSTITSLWKARQYADALGLPYDKYISLAFKYAIQRNCTQFPRPNQLYSDKVLKAVEQGWQKGKRDGLYGYGFPLPNDVRFKNESYAGSLVQKSYRGKQIRYVHDSPRDEVKLKRIAQFCFKRETLPISLIENEFEVDFEQVEKYWDGIRFDFEGGAISEDLRPACFALPHVKPEDPNICNNCSLGMCCQNEREIVRKRVIDKCGSDNPRGNIKRQKATERKRKQRYRERQTIAEHRCVL